MLNTNRALRSSGVVLLLYASLALLNDKSRTGIGCSPVELSCSMFEVPPAVTDSWFRRWVEVNLLLPKWLNCSCKYFPSKIRTWGEKFRISVDRNIAAMPQHSCGKQQGPQL